MHEIINNIDDYIHEIKEIVKNQNVSPIFIKTLIEGISSYVATISAFSTEFYKQGFNTNDIDLVLEKLYTLITVLEIKAEELEDK